MTKLELKNHQVWHDLTEILENLDSNALLREHLELCDYKVCGYWDGNRPRGCRRFKHNAFQEWKEL